ncbi:hypothetical protein AKO1_006266, partial [Acrasis kona]
MYRDIVCTASLVPLWLIIDRDFVFESRKEATSTMTKWKRFFIGKIPDWKTNLILLISGTLLIPCNQLLFIFGLQHTSPMVAGIFQPSSVVFTAFISIALRFEQKSLIKFIGIGVAVVGAITMIIVSGSNQPKQQDDSTFNIFGFDFSINGIIGSCLFLFNTLAFSSYLNVQKLLAGKNIPAFTVTIWTFFYGTLQCIIVCLFFINSMDYSQTHGKSIWLLWGCTLFAGIIGGSIPFVVTTYSSGILSPIVVSIYSTTVPVFSMILEFITLGHLNSYWSILCCSLIIAGVLMVGYAKYQESKVQKEKKDLEDVLQIDHDTELNLVSDLTNDSVVEEHLFKEPTSSEIL